MSNHIWSCPVNTAQGTFKDIWIYISILICIWCIYLAIYHIRDKNHGMLRKYCQHLYSQGNGRCSNHSPLTRIWQYMCSCIDKSRQRTRCTLMDHLYMFCTSLYTMRTVCLPQQLHLPGIGNDKYCPSHWGASFPTLGKWCSYPESPNMYHNLRSISGKWNLHNQLGRYSRCRMTFGMYSLWLRESSGSMEVSSLCRKCCSRLDLRCNFGKDLRKAYIFRSIRLSSHLLRWLLFYLYLLYLSVAYSHKFQMGTLTCKSCHRGTDTLQTRCKWRTHTGCRCIPSSLDYRVYKYRLKHQSTFPKDTTHSSSYRSISSSQSDDCRNSTCSDLEAPPRGHTYNMA